MPDAKSDPERLGHKPRRGDKIIARGEARSAQPLVRLEMIPSPERATERQCFSRPFRAQTFDNRIPGATRCALRPWLLSCRPFGARATSVPMFLGSI